MTGYVVSLTNPSDGLLTELQSVAVFLFVLCLPICCLTYCSLHQPVSGEMFLDTMQPTSACQ